MGRYVFFVTLKEEQLISEEASVGVAINVLYLGHTFLPQILCPLVFPHISLLAPPNSTFDPFLRILPHFCSRFFSNSLLWGGAGI